MAHAMFHSVIVQMDIRVMAVHVMILMSVLMTTTIAMEMLLVSTLPVATLVLAIADIPETVLFVAMSMNVISIMTTVIPMQHAQILPVASNAPA